MTNLFRNSSPGALTLRQGAEQAKKQLIARGRQMRQARELAAQGRGSDTEVAHVARGEYVIPEAMQTPEVRAVLRRAAAVYGVPLEMLSVGNAMKPHQSKYRCARVWRDGLDFGAVPRPVTSIRSASGSG